jgi:PAS domain S-box-containing protein
MKPPRSVKGTCLLALIAIQAFFTVASFCAAPYQPVYGDPLLEPWRWRTFPELSGLGAQCIAEGADGTLWFGTADGIWSFDGTDWVYHSNEKISGGSVTTLCRGLDGTLYAGGRWGINQFRDGKWTSLFPPSRKRFGELRKITVAPDGALWAATAWGALRFQNSKWTLFTAPETAAELRAGKNHPTLEIELMPEAILNRARGAGRQTRRHDLAEISADRQGRIWLGTELGEVLCLEPPATSASAKEGSPNAAGSWSLYNELDGLVCGRIPSILPLHDGSVWVGYGTGSGHLNVFDGATWKATPLAKAGVPDEVGGLVQTRDGVVWLSGRYVIGAYRAGQWTLYEKPAVPIPSARNFILQTADGALWIAGPNTEVQRVDYGTPRWLTLKDLNFQWESPAGAQWFLHRSGRVVVHDSGKWTSYGDEDGVIDAPVALVGTKGGDVWAAGSHGPMAATARFSGGKWTRFVHADFSWGVEWRAVRETSDGSVWFGAAVDTSGPKEHRAGLLQFRDNTWTHHHQPGRAPPGGNDNDPASLLPATQRPEPIGKFLALGESRDGKIWAGRNILIFQDGRAWKTFSPPPGFRVGIIETLFTSNERDLWIGTRQFGALRYDGRDWERFQGKGSLVANTVRSLAQTTDGSIWAATDHGVSRFDGQRWTADLLPAALLVPHEGGSLKSAPSGGLWINRFAQGWMMRSWSKAPPIDPATCEFWTVCHRFDGTPPETIITVGSARVAQPGNLSIIWNGTAPWRDSADTRLQYSFRLDDQPWSPFTEERGHAFFTLPSGKHRFEVRARDRDFNVDPTPAVLDFVVLPPVWRQAWFIGLMALLAGAVITQSLRVVLERGRLRRTNRALAEEIRVREQTEAALRVSETNLKEAQQLAHVGSWHLDLISDRMDLTEEVHRIFEVDPTQFGATYEAFLATLHPDDRALVDRAYKESVRNRTPFDIEHRLLLPGGRVKFIHERCRTVYAEDGRPLRSLGTAQDITDRRHKEQRIRQLNRTYSVLSDINQLIVRAREPRSIFEGACRIAVEKGGFRMAWIGMLDAAAKALTPMASAGVIDGYLDTMSIDPRNTSSAARPVMSALATGAHQICNDIARDAAAASWREPALRLGYRASAAFPLTIAGKIVGTFSLYAGEPDLFDPEELRLLDELAMDISFALEGCEREGARQRAIEQLSFSEVRFRELAETIEDVFWITDPAKNRMLYISPAYEKIWGRTCQSLAEDPSSWLAAIHADDRERISHAAATRQVAGTYDEEYRVVRPDGQIRWVRDQAFPVRNAAGEVERVLGVARDITERRKLEDQFRQSQKMEAIGQLAGGVAHDFNNLLAAMLMQTELTSTIEVLPAEAREGLKDIRTTIQRAANLTRQLLLFSRRQVMQPRDLDLNEVVTNLAKLLQRIIGEDVRLQLNLHSSPLVTRADAGMLEQVLMNLAVNARDAMPTGGRLLIETLERTVDEAFARIHPDATAGRFVCLKVSDTGSGIPPEVMPRIFEPFFTTKDPGKGTGLGLATVFGIVKQHQGWMEVTSEPGAGASFQIYLPASAAVLEAPARTAAPMKPRGGAETVLVVEDELVVRTLTRTILERHGYRVFTAANGAEALSIWAEHKAKIALLVTDLVMPGGLNGQQLAKQLQAEQPRLKVVFVSGYSTDVAGKELPLRNGENFLQKPFGQDMLLKTVRRGLDS